MPDVIALLEESRDLLLRVRNHYPPDLSRQSNSFLWDTLHRCNELAGRLDDAIEKTQFQKTLSEIPQGGKPGGIFDFQEK